MGKSGFYGILVMLGLFLSAAAPVEARVIGEWLTVEGKSKVEIRNCGEKLCGAIVWLKEPNDEEGRPKLDANNKDEALRNRPILGLDLIKDFVPGDSEGEWVDGKIYNPEDGDVYSCTMTLQEDGSLRVRGYVGIPLFGKTQVWTPVKQE